MAFLHCHKCGWEQDDFWHIDGYNPIHYLYKQGWVEDLFKEGLITFQDYNDNETIKEITPQEWVAREFERWAKVIRNMVYRTEAEFKKLNPDRKCPKCGYELDVD